MTLTALPTTPSAAPAAPAPAPATPAVPAASRPKRAGGQTARHGPAPCRQDPIPVRVWQLPIRIIHWTVVGSIVVLSVTGYYIGNPNVLPGSSTHPVATVRAVHVATGLIFTAALIARFAMLFTGNQWARWQQFLPLCRRRRRLIMPSLRYYLFLEREAPPVVGHNPLAGMTYVVLYTMLAVQALTGIALMAVQSRGEGWEWALSGWVFDLFTVPSVRFGHHLIMWLAWGFFLHHMYAAIMVDREERSGEISSIITGWKVLPRERIERENRQWRRSRARERC